jgi:hypothetical protein
VGIVGEGIAGEGIAGEGIAGEGIVVVVGELLRFGFGQWVEVVAALLMN